MDPENIARVKPVLVGQQPDVGISHWPVDTHPDHRYVWAITLSPYLDPEARFDFFFFKVMTGQRSLHFHPTHYADKHRP